MQDIYLASGLISLRPLTPEDAPLLLKWMTDPTVLEWYEGRDAEFTPELIREHFYTRDPDEPDMRRCIIEEEDRPVGYVQIYPLEGELFSEYQYEPPGSPVFAADQFLGEPDCWNRHIGRTFLSLLLRYLTEQESAASVVLDPRVSNLRAIRCYEACGFRKRKLLPAHELHEGVMEDCWLMEYRAENAF